MTILVGTPCYNGMLHQDYVKSVIEYSNMKFPINYMHIGNESLITRGRNTIISYFYHEREKYTHLLFIDADIYLPAEGLQRLMAANADVIGAAVPMKGFNADGTHVFNVSGKVVEDKKTKLFEVERVGTAVLMLSRAAVESLIEDAIKDNRVYPGNTLTRGEKSPKENYDIFSVGVKNGMYLSEDYWVCVKLRELGYKVLVDPSIMVRHSGMFTWSSDDINGQ